jgi:hypothetical protein
MAASACRLAEVSEIAHEMPFVPGDFVGLPQGTRTGPHLPVWIDEPTANEASNDGTPFFFSDQYDVGMDSGPRPPR